MRIVDLENADTLSEKGDGIKLGEDRLAGGQSRAQGGYLPKLANTISIKLIIRVAKGTFGCAWKPKIFQTDSGY
jgi:hypothetical protein